MNNRPYSRSDRYGHELKKLLGEIIKEGKITSLKHFQDEIKEIDVGKECGIGIEGMKNFEEGDLIETYTTEEVKRTLEA